MKETGTNIKDMVMEFIHTPPQTQDMAECGKMEIKKDQEKLFMRTTDMLAC